MDVIYGLIPMMLFFGFLVVVVFIWMAKKGYFDDLDGQANRILMDDDDFEVSEVSADKKKEKESQNKTENKDKTAKETSAESKSFINK